MHGAAYDESSSENQELNAILEWCQEYSLQNDCSFDEALYQHHLQNIIEEASNNSSETNDDDNDNKDVARAPLGVKQKHWPGALISWDWTFRPSRSDWTFRG